MRPLPMYVIPMHPRSVFVFSSVFCEFFFCYEVYLQFICCILSLFRVYLNFYINYTVGLAFFLDIRAYREKVRVN